MEKSKILDRMIEEETRLEVRALSSDMRKPLNLDAVLVDYDNVGFLYRARESRGSSESAFYVPRNALAFMKFSAESSSYENPQNNSAPVKTINQPELDENTYSAFGVTYNVKTRELRKGSQKRVMKGQLDHFILERLFKAGPEDVVTSDSCKEGLTRDAKNPSSAVTSKMTVLRGILKNFGLSIYNIPNKGYTLREL